MYFLKSRFKCFENEFEAFDSVSEAVQRALAVGLSREEFDVFNADGVRVAGVVTASREF